MFKQDEGQQPISLKLVNFPEIIVFGENGQIGFKLDQQYATSYLAISCKDFFFFLEYFSMMKYIMYTKVGLINFAKQIILGKQSIWGQFGKKWWKLESHDQPFTLF